MKVEVVRMLKNITENEILHTIKRNHSQSIK